MKKINFDIEIKDEPQKVYETMLGLNDKNTYNDWTSVFDPSSRWEGSWDKGSKILFLGSDENGQEGGMVSRIRENRPAREVSIEHLGIFDKGKEITEGADVASWAGSQENYYFDETAEGTRIRVEMDSTDEHADFFQESWPKALKRLKEVCEGNGKTS
jgi:hypothetical protein